MSVDSIFTALPELFAVLSLRIRSIQNAGDDGLTFKAKIRTILVNNPAGILWWGISICIGRKVLYDLVYYQRVMTILELSVKVISKRRANIDVKDVSLKKISFFECYCFICRLRYLYFSEGSVTRLDLQNGLNMKSRKD